MVRWSGPVVGTLIAAAIGASACGRSATVERGGWTDLLRDARMHEARANEQDLAAEYAAREGYAPEDWNCGDQQLWDQATSGGRQLTTFRPCVNLKSEAISRHRRAAAAERAAAQRDRMIAATLVRHEVAACGGLPAAQRAGSIFSQPQLVSRVTPLGAEGAPLGPGEAPHGVRVVLSGPGLTAATVRSRIACRRAQWAVLGDTPDALRDDPTLIRGARIAVRDVPGGVAVDVITPDVLAARDAIARAHGGPPTQASR